MVFLPIVSNKYLVCLSITTMYVLSASDFFLLVKSFLNKEDFDGYHTIVLAKTSPHAREDVDKRLGIL